MQVTHLYTIASKVDQVPKVPGQLLFVTDSPAIYFDVSETQRIPYVEIIELATEAERTGLLAPLPKFYWVKGTKILWRYDGGWHRVTTTVAASSTEGNITVNGQDIKIYTPQQVPTKLSDLTNDVGFVTADHKHNTLYSRVEIVRW